MAKQIKYIFVIMTATYFLFAGTGYNISKNNCECCKLSKSIHNKIFSCNKIADNSEIIDNFNKIFNKNKTCVFVRVFVDIPIVNGINLLNLISPKNIGFKYIKLISLINTQKPIAVNINKPPNNVFVISGRNILSLKAVLRI
jgi:hypothetical protein